MISNMYVPLCNRLYAIEANSGKMIKGVFYFHAFVRGERIKKHEILS